MRNLLGWFFGFIADLINGAEKSFLDFLSALVPYCVPVIPAYLTYVHVQREMEFDVWIAWTAAVVVETLGMASVSTAIRFWYHNQRYKNSSNQAPFRLAIGVYIFYLVVVILVNVILEIVAGQRGGWIILAIALFTMLSVPSGVLIAIRAQYSEVLGAIEKRYSHGKPATNQSLPEPQGGTLRKEKHASDYADRIAQMLETEYSRSGQVLTPKQITTRLGLDHTRNKGFVSTLTSRWKAGKGIS